MCAMISDKPKSRFSEIRLVVYDMDGTLIDAFVDIHDGINTVLKRFGLPPRTMDDVRRGVGDGARMLIARMLPPEAQGLLDEAYHAYRAYYAAHPIVRAGLYPGVAATLDRLRLRGVHQAILTNKPDEVARPICDKLGLTGVVDGIWGEVDGVPSKPDPEALLAIVRHFGLEPAQCAMVGDGHPDCMVARAAGARFFGVTWGQMSRDDLVLHRPDAMLESFEQLNSLI